MVTVRYSAEDAQGKATSSSEADRAIANAKNAIAHKWLSEATMRIDHCIEQKDKNPAAAVADKEARTAQYLLSEAEFYYENTGTQHGIGAIQVQYKRLRDAGVKILAGDELNFLFIDRHAQMIDSGKRLGFNVYVEDLTFYKDRRIAQAKGTEIPENPPSSGDATKTLLFVGEEAMKFALADLYDGKSTPTTGDLIAAAFWCAKLIGVEKLSEWENMIDAARAAQSERSGLVQLKRHN